MGVARFLRCNPWGTSGFDPVPDALPSNARWWLPWTYSNHGHEGLGEGRALEARKIQSPEMVTSAKPNQQP